MEIFPNKDGFYPSLRVFEIMPDTMIIVENEYELAFPTEFENSYILMREEMWPPKEEKRLTRK